MIDVLICPAGHGTFLPPRRICPDCGIGVEPATRSGASTILAATELASPAEGWTAPHRLVFAELDGGGRLLALATDLPEVGAHGNVERRADGLYHWARSVAAAP